MIFRGIERDPSSSDTTELEVPSQVILPAGQSSVEIPVSVVDDFVFDGVKSVEVTATTAEYVSGSLISLSKMTTPANSRHSGCWTRVLRRE